MPVADLAIKYLFNNFRVTDLSYVTGIAERTLYRYKSTLNIPTVSKYNTLFNRYRSVIYTQLRSAGASTKQANRFKGAAPTKINEIVRKYQQTAVRLATEYKVDYNVIMENMSKSEKDYEEINESP